VIDFRITSARPLAHSVSPTLLFGLRVEAPRDRRVHGIVLQVQIRIEPARRTHEPKEQRVLAEVFGAQSRWKETQRPLSWTEVSIFVPPFEHVREIELPVPCTYDLDLASTKYFHAIQEGDVPLTFFFRGTVFCEGVNGLEVALLPWDREASFMLSASTWRAVMDAFFPEKGWLLLRRDLLDALLELKAKRALPSWDALVQDLLERGGTT